MRLSRVLKRVSKCFKVFQGVSSGFRWDSRYFKTVQDVFLSFLVVLDGCKKF